jgi:hypothetical protein
MGRSVGVMRLFFDWKSSSHLINSSATRKNIPQGLKPDEFSAIYGTAEAEPFQNTSFFRKLFGRALIQTLWFSSQAVK